MVKSDFVKPDFNIIRDERYRRTIRRDMLKQHVRRITHRVMGWYEHHVKVPQWEQWQVSGKRKTLSACIVTRDSEHRIGPLLKYIRPLCDEIVVGIDSRTADNTLAFCKDLADEAFIFESTASTGDFGLEAVVKRCHGDWILRLDDDEFIEPHFAWIKNGLLADDRFTHYKLPRLHLCDIDPLLWINDGYLYPDFQLRLFKNDLSLLTFPGNTGHTGIKCQGKRGRINTVDLLHLNLAINPRHKREEKLKRYVNRLNGGWVHPINEHALLFEDFNYHTEPYQYPDKAFCQLLSDTIRQQYDRFVSEQPQQREVSVPN